MPPVGQTRAYVALLLIVTLWGTFPSTAKLALGALPPVLLTTIRCTIAAMFLVVLLLRADVTAFRGLGRDSLRRFVMLGFFGPVVSTNLSYLGIYTTTAANAAILQAMGPVIIALGARTYLGERLPPGQLAGVAVSTLGVLLVVTDGRFAALRPEDLRPGDFITLLALVGWAVFTVYGRRVLRLHSPALTTAASYTAGAVMMTALAALTAPLFPRPRLTSAVAWAVVLYQALFGAVAHVWWYRAVERVGPSRSGVFMNVTPIVGVALAALLLGEPIGPWQVAGAVCVLGGVGLTTRAG